MTTPTCRRARISDLEQLIELRVLMQIEVNKPKEPEGLGSYRQALRDYFLEHLAHDTYISIVAENDGQLVAANGLVVFRKPPSVTGGTGLFGQVMNVYTRPEWRGQGLAGKLMELLIEQAKGLGVTRLQLTATELGRGVYERVGFKPPRFPAFELDLL